MNRPVITLQAPSSREDLERWHRETQQAVDTHFRTADHQITQAWHQEHERLVLAHFAARKALAARFPRSPVLYVNGGR